MQGLVFKGSRQVGLETFPDPLPGPGEVVVAMRAEVTLDPSTGDPVEAIRALSHAEGADARRWNVLAIPRRASIARGLRDPGVEPAMSAHAARPPST
jgi:hypothetical protein